MLLESFRWAANNITVILSNWYQLELILVWQCQWHAPLQRIILSVKALCEFLGVRLVGTDLYGMHYECIWLKRTLFERPAQRYLIMIHKLIFSLSNRLSQKNVFFDLTGAVFSAGSFGFEGLCWKLVKSFDSKNSKEFAGHKQKLFTTKNFKIKSFENSFNPMISCFSYYSNSKGVQLLQLNQTEGKS